MVTLSTSRSQSKMAVAVPVLTVLTTVQGLQLLRVFVPTLLFYLQDVVGLNTIALGGVGGAVFLSPVLAAPLQRLIGLHRALALTAGGTALLRAVEQFSISPRLDMALSTGGTALFLLFVPLALGGLRSSPSPRVSSFALALLAGVAADNALHIVAGSYDLTWQAGPWPALLLVLALLTWATLFLALPAFARRPAEVPWRRAWPLMAFGPWLALQLIVFQNPARTAAVSGWSLPAVGFAHIAGNILALLAAAWLAAAWPRWGALVAGAGLVLVSWPLQATGAAAALLVVVGQILSGALLMRAFSASIVLEAREAGLARSTAAYGVGQLLLTLLFFAYNAAHSLTLPFTEVMVLPLMAFFLALPAWLAPRIEAGRQPVWPARSLLLASVLLLLAPAGLALSWEAPQAVAPTASLETVRVLNYNLHNGFNVAGRLDMEALAQVIEESDADVVVLQEVSRGWVVAGSLDMLEWLGQRLGMEITMGPTTSDRQWGNAILSRYPIVASENHSLPSEGLPLQRGYLQAEIDVGGAPLHVVSTHLHQIGTEGHVREVQVEALLADWQDTPQTIIAGDFNARPDSREIEMMREAGMVDVAGVLADDAAYSHPAEAPVRRIDYIWLSPDLVPEQFSMRQTTASDHLPLLTVVRLPSD